MDHRTRERAIRRIRARRHLSIHFAFFLVMTIYLVTVWARSGSPFFWPIWAIFGWGIGLFSHAAHVLGWQRPISEQRIQREVDRGL
ncbi:MAG: 2TM domain-containing protein [Acidimicrobiia bacterium]|nr:2TM domain-containing protein [Acidimicrobiia bacterium]